ncbi:MAG: N-acetyltransferase [Peptococcaceae bacterium]|jgi:hypothetical protein|nr:N-acetyltransferase [Peptococcaceae bacterium]
MAYYQVNLRDMIAELGEEETKNILSSYLCPKNADIEYFLKNKAIEFAKQGIAATHLVFTDLREVPVLIGYFALSNKTIHISKRALNYNYQRRIKRFATPYDSGYMLSTLLIAQLGKNFTNEYNKLITGDELLKMALDKVKQLGHHPPGYVISANFFYTHKLPKPST